MRKCVIHVGVHKTGTTYIQSVLKANTDTFEKNGIAYIPPREMRRKNVIRDFIYSGNVVEGRQWLLERVGAADTVLFSDEELLGRYFWIENGFPYKDAKQYVSNIVDMLPEGTIVDVLVSLRNYADFIESCYLQFLKYHVAKPYRFEKYLNQFDLTSSGWVGLIHDVAAVPGVSGVHVWPYESFRKDNRQIFSLLESLVQSKIDIPQYVDVSNPSLSLEALRILRVAKGLKKEHHKRLRQLLISDLVTTNGYEKPQLLTLEIRNQWDEKYHKDLLDIRAFCAQNDRCAMYSHSD